MDPRASEMCAWCAWWTRDDIRKRKRNRLLSQGVSFLTTQEEIYTNELTSYKCLTLSPLLSKWSTSDSILTIKSYYLFTFVSILFLRLLLLVVLMRVFITFFFVFSITLMAPLLQFLIFSFLLLRAIRFPSSPI